MVLNFRVISKFSSANTAIVAVGPGSCCLLNCTVEIRMGRDFLLTVALLPDILFTTYNP